MMATTNPRSGPVAMLRRLFGLGGAPDRAAMDDFARRHAVLARGHGSRPDPADPDSVQAMQLVLHIEKREPPARSAVLAAAASSVVALCLDERCGPGGEWEAALHGWLDARIRKVSRRARGKHWQDVQLVPGVTVESDGAQARAFVPGPVGAIDPRVRRLQISGTDLPEDDPGEPAAGLPVIWIDAGLAMTTGKAAAQVGHAAMILAGAMDTERARAWAQAGFACSVRDAGPDTWERLRRAVRTGKAVAVRDAGFTEVAPGSMTVIAEPGIPAG